MADEDGRLERKIEFLVEAQARASAQIEKLAEAQASLTRSMGRPSERTKIVEDRLEATRVIVEHIAEQITSLTATQARNEGASEKRFKALGERLNILVNVVNTTCQGRAISTSCESSMMGRTP